MKRSSDLGMSGLVIDERVAPAYSGEFAAIDYVQQ
jgi:hypothetical protein